MKRLKVVRVIVMDGRPERVNEILKRSWLTQEGSHKNVKDCTIKERIRVEQEYDDGTD